MRARPNGTWRTSPGSSRLSCSSATKPASRRSTRRFRVLFNSYYQGVGERHPRAAARPDHAADAGRGASATARSVDERDAGAARDAGARRRALTDARHARPAPRAAAPGAAADRHQACASLQPAAPRLRAALADDAGAAAAAALVRATTAGWSSIGHDAALDGAFCFDNETPRHRSFLAPFELASRPVSYGEYLAFMDDGGYRRPELWLSMGWDWVSAERRGAPLYWRERRRPAG